MKAYKYDLAIHEHSEQEADSKIKSLSVLASKLSAKELERLAHVVEHEPLKLAMAKKGLGL